MGIISCSVSVPVSCSTKLYDVVCVDRMPFVGAEAVVGGVVSGVVSTGGASSVVVLSLTVICI